MLEAELKKLHAAVATAEAETKRVQSTVHVAQAQRIKQLEMHEGSLTADLDHLRAQGKVRLVSTI